MVPFYLGAVLVLCAHICSTYTLAPCACTRNFDLVCGSDGLTYSNPCLLECAAITARNKELKLVKKGPCEGSIPRICVCPDDYSPVCGNDGETYPSKCELECERHNFDPTLVVDYPGDCKQVPTNMYK